MELNEYKYELEQSAKFKKDLKTAIKRGYDIRKLDETVDLLQKGISLSLKYHDHALTGDMAEWRECHIAPNWLLVYRIEENVLVLYLLRTGTHSDIF
jgi:mRNA interferase YafQ